MKGYFLSSCSTCTKIIKELNLPNHFKLQDIKTNKISPTQLEEMKELTGSYESLFSRRAMKYRSEGLHEKSLTENNYRDLILKEYTFLKRPVFIIGNEIFVGNSEGTISELKSKLER
jgi:arsenate reductase